MFKRARSPSASANLLLCLLGLALILALGAGRVAAAAEAESPATCLYDTDKVELDSLLTTEAIAAKAGWKQLEEDDLTHKFRGAAVLVNDRLTVVLRGAGAEVYSRTATGWKSRATLLPLLASGMDARNIASIAILENNPGAVMVEATFAAPGGRVSTKYRLTTGQATVEVRPGGDMARLLVASSYIRHLVVPDFFGDDMVFDAKATLAPDREVVGLPCENFLLGMLGAGDAMLMCVWPSSQQQAEPLTQLPSGRGDAQVIDGCKIDCLKDKSIWVAFLEGAGLWYEQSIAANASATVNLDWKPPFPARWRADFLKPGAQAESWTFRGAADPEDAAAAASADKCPCRIDEGRALVCLPEKKPTPGDAKSGQRVLVYPIDRNRATPLTAFCPMDVLRNTLGVGPCQYILQKEGLASETNPTTDVVMTWVETQFKKKKQKKAAGEIGELLRQMTEHVKHAQAKIERYGELAKQVRALAKTGQTKDDSSLAERLLPTVERLEQSAAGAASGPERAAKLAAEVNELVDKGGALADCQRLATEIRRVGAEQDRTLSNCRMAARWLKQQCRAAATENAARPKIALAESIAAEAEKVLR